MGATKGIPIQGDRSAWDTEGFAPKHAADIDDSEKPRYHWTEAQLQSLIGDTSLSDLSDVAVDIPADNEVLAYDTGSGNWTSQAPAEAGLAEAAHTHLEFDITDLDHTDLTAFHRTVAGEIAAVAEKAAPVSADLLLMEDSEDSYAKKRVHVGNLPGGSGGGDAGDVTYTPSDAADWDGNEDPGNVDDALDQLAARVDDVESGTLMRQTIVTFTGELSVSSGPLRIYNKLGVTQMFSEVWLSVGTAPSGAAIIVDVNKGGSTIFTNPSHRPHISDGAHTGTTTSFDVTTWEAGTYLSVDIDQIGSVTGGSDLVVHISHY